MAVRRRAGTILGKKRNRLLLLMLSMMIWGAGRKFYRGKYYIVQKGDNLWNIAKRFYGAGAEYYRIVRKNHLQDPNHIEVGQKLYL